MYRSIEQSLGVWSDGSQATYSHLHNRTKGSKDGQHFSVSSCKGPWFTTVGFSSVGYYLTLYNRVLHENLTVAQIVKEFKQFLKPKGLDIVLRRARHFPLSSLQLHLTRLNFILILSYHTTTSFKCTFLQISQPKCVHFSSLF